MSRRRERRGVVMRSRAKAEDSTYSQPLKSVSRVPELRESSRITCDKKFDCDLLIVPYRKALSKAEPKRIVKARSQRTSFIVCVHRQI